MNSAFDSIALQLSVPLVLLSPDGQVRGANQAAADALGYPLSELKGDFSRFVRAAGDLQRYLDLCARTLSPLPGRLEQSHAEGRRRFRCEGARLRNSDEPQILLRFWRQSDRDVFLLLNQQIEALNAEVIRRRKVEAALRRRETELKRLSEAGIIGIIYSRLNGSILDANARALEIIGYPHEDLTAGLLRWDTITAPEHEGISRRAVEQLLTTGRTELLEKEYIRKDGRRVPVLLGSALLEEGVPDKAITFILDVSQQKHTEHELEIAVDRLSRNLSLNETFLSVLGHDLRTPLSAILMSATLLAKSPSGDDAARISERISSSAKRMGRMIEQLLDASRARIGGGFPIRPQAVDLEVVCREGLSEVATVHERTVIELDARGACSGRWDPDRLAQVVSNLLDNAIHHSDPDGPVRIILDGRDCNTVELRVSNPGVIPSELLPRLFKPFEQSEQGRQRRQGVGLGLGLYITHEIVRGHGGEIEVSSNETQGTTISVRLPRYTQPQVPQASDAATDMAEPDGQETQTRKEKARLNLADRA